MSEITPTSFFLETNFQNESTISASQSARTLPSVSDNLTSSQQIESLILQMDEELDLIKIAEPEKIVFDDIGSDNSILFYPSFKPNKIFKESYRNLEDEGLFVNEKPQVKATNLNLMHDRLDDSWFDETGYFKNWFNAFSSIVYRPLQTQYKPLPQEVPAVKFENINVVKNDTLYILQLKLNKIEFSYHNLFSLEHVLSHKLINLYNKYEERNRSCTTDRLQKKLNALRNAKYRFENTLQDAINREQKQRLSAYEEDIRDMKWKWISEAETDRKLLRHILKVWMQIKSIRAEQAYSNTNTKLVIVTQDVDGDIEQENWESQMEVFIKENISDMQNDYLKKKLEYKSALKNYRNYLKEKDDNSSIESVDKPVKPLYEIDEVKINKEVKEIFENSLKPPGEPVVKLSLVQTEISRPEFINGKDKHRLDNVKNTRISFKLLLDDKEVAKSEYKVLNDDFSVEFNKLFSMQTIKFPNSIQIQISEQFGMFNNTKTATVYVAPPDDDVDYDSAPEQKYSFTSSEPIVFSDFGGSGDNLQIFNELFKDKQLYTSGSIYLTCGWESDDSGKFKSNTHEDKAVKHLTIDNKINMFKDWFQQGLIDPNEPGYGTLLDLIKNNEVDIAKTKNCFRLNPEVEDFCSPDVINNNIRLQTLNWRFKKIEKYKNLKLISTNIRDLISERMHEDTVDVEQELNEWDQQRYRGKKYLMKAYEALATALSKATKNEIINETDGSDILLIGSVPNFRSLFSSILNVFRPRRPLRPSRQPNTSSTANIHIPIARSRRPNEETLMTIHVVRALNVPLRMDDVTSPFARKSDISSEISHTAVNVRPFVLVSYKNLSSRTATAEGYSPTWNQELQIPLTNCLSGSLYIQLYDEKVEDILHDDRNSEIHQRLNNHWLGGVKIPLQCLQSVHRIEGTLKLNTPRILLGYQSSHVTNHVEIDLEDPSTRPATYLMVYLSIDPIFEENDQFPQGTLHSGEPRPLEEHLSSWSALIKEDLPHRHFNPLVTLLTGQTVCLTRLIAPVQLPPLPEINTYSIARFVSMIPVQENENKGSSCGLRGIWLTAEKLLQLLYGSIRDLAVLLCCYFTAMHIECYLLLGKVIGRGESAFVLTREEKEWFLWDPLTAERLRSYDNLSPLQMVYGLISQDNIWVNVQTETRPHMSQWDVTRLRDWRPCFNKNIMAPEITLQPAQIIYEQTAKTTSLEQRIFKRVMVRIEKWRKHRTTTWNRIGNDVLSKILPKLEEDCIYNLDSQPNLGKLQQLFLSYKVNGFPINLPYVKMASLIENVRASGIHLNDDEHVEFSLAVNVYAYPANVLSVWIFIAALVPRKY